MKLEEPQDKEGSREMSSEPEQDANAASSNAESEKVPF